MSEAVDNSTPQRRRPRKLNKSRVDEGHSFQQLPGLPPDMSSLSSRNERELAFPIVDGSSFLTEAQTGYVGSEDDSVDEGDLKRHFMDVESSFLPDVVPGISRDNLHGADDTYLELGKPGHTPPLDDFFGSVRSGKFGLSKQEQGDTASSTKESTPERMRNDQSEGDEDTSSTTSPAADAARRTRARTTSAAVMANTVAMRAFSMSARPASKDSARPTSKGSNRPTSKGSTIRPSSSRKLGDAVEPSSDNMSFLKSRQSPTSVHEQSDRRDSRPSLQSGRHDSQHSTTSSATRSSELSGSDAANADYALQTGGAVSARSPVKPDRISRMLSRIPSVGSVASNLDESDTLPTLSGLMSRSRGTKTGSRFDSLEERPETPRADDGHSQAPTDTVLAQRVESIQVPETIARDFFAKNRSFSPNKRPASSAGVGANLADQRRKTLTLKEQNSKIDKLAKENFDLKLKIHFLDQALQSRSDDGVKELIDKNVQLQTDLANERKESQTMRRKMKELERKLSQHEEETRQQKRKVDDSNDETLQADMHEEILYLRQQLDHSENQVTTLREEIMTKELEKRKMAEHIKSQAGSRGKDTSNVKETMDMWQDLLNAETSRREQVEEDMRKLREELTTLRIEKASMSIPRDSKMSSRRPRHGYSQSAVQAGDSDFANSSEPSTILVEQLKTENAELRRDLGAQTSMLTSRNRERERLQQEIEDLKLFQRKGDGARSIAGESIFERSISRAHQRAPSRSTELLAPSEAERDDWETKEGQLRDQNAELRLKYQELERNYSQHLEYVAALEGDFQEMEQELNEAQEDLKALQSERDEALQAFEDKESDYEKLEQEALAEIDKLMKEIEGMDAELQDTQKKLLKTQTKLEHTSDGYKGLQSELRDITQSVMNLDDEKQAHVRNIQTLEQQIQEAEDEIQKWEQKCNEYEQKHRKLEITQESLTSEITFLREEQEGDKIKIGELENGLNAAQQTIEDEEEKVRELEEGIIEERQQRDVLANQSKEEVQKVLDGLHAESAKTRDEVRRLRRELSSKEIEAGTWKQRLEELEESLRAILGDPNGTKHSLLAEIQKTQLDLETIVNQLDRATMDLADKDRLLRHRDGLLESTSLESRRLADLLDKERNSRKRDLEQFEKSSRGSATHMRTVAQQESRILELETAFSQDKRKMAAQEQDYQDELNERNSLLLALWNRLSTICGTDWAQTHCLVNGEVPSVDVIARGLPAFNHNIIAAVKMIEALFGSFKVRIRNIEKDLARDYQTLENNLNLRIQRMDSLEEAVQRTQSALADGHQRQTLHRSLSKSSKSTDELNKLKTEIKLLRAELKFHRQYPSAMAQQMIHQQNHQVGPEGARRLSLAGSTSNPMKPSSPARNMVAQLLRHHSTSSTEPLHPHPPEHQQQQSIILSQPALQPSETRLVYRIKELERQLKAEREKRLLDRQGARQRLEELRLEIEELKLRLQRERARNDGLGDGVKGGDMGSGVASAVGSVRGRDSSVD